MLAIYNVAEPVVFKAPKASSNAERVPQGTKPVDKPGHKNNSKKRKESNSVMDLNPSQPPVSTPVDTDMHKEDQQATGGPTSLGVTSEARANPQLSSGMSAFNLNEPIYSASFIIHSESASGNDASLVSTTEVDPRKYAPSDFVKEDEASRTNKLKDLAKLVSSVQPSFKDLDSPKDYPIIVVDDSDEDEEADEVHATTNVKTEDTSVPKSSSPRTSQIQELTNQVLILQSQKHKLEREKNKAEAALLKAQPSFPNVGQLNELLVKSLQTKFSKILSAHDFSSSLPTELKDLPSKFHELNKEVKGLKKQVHELEIELPGDLKEIPSKLEDFTKTVTILTSQLDELKTLNLLNKVTNALNQFAQAIASKKTRDTSVPSAGQAGTQSAEGEKNTNQATISQLF
ncbi:hypothetical protein Tco_0153929 [Tanacetum coccineum]